MQTQLAKTEQESARQACQAKYVEGSDLFRAENWDDAIATFEAGGYKSAAYLLPLYCLPTFFTNSSVSAFEYDQS